MTAAEKIAGALGGLHHSGHWSRCRCPVHGSAGASLALRDGDRGLIVHCHAGCPPSDILVELRRRGLLGDTDGAIAPPEPAAEQGRSEAEAADRRRRINLARDMWQSALPVSGTVADRYLRSRDIEIPLPPSIRFIGMHTPYAWHAPSGDRRPVMVAAVEHVDHGLVAVTRTFLALDGSGKASLAPPRLFTGPVAGGAVRLAAIRPSDWLAVGEGVETVLSVMQACKLPGWAALSANGLESLLLPPEAQMVLIAADNDMNGTGQRSALVAAARFRSEGRRVKVIAPPLPDTDWNDVLLGRAPGIRRAA